MLKNSLKGTGVAIITPFKKGGEVDFEALSNLIDFQVDSGVNYIVSLGTTGETPVLSKNEKNNIIEHTYKHVNGRVPVVIGMGGNCTAELIDEIKQANLDGCTAILSASPYYNKPSQEGLYQHYAALAGMSPKPIILYNVPGRTGMNMSATTTLRLAHDFEKISGIKEASGDMLQCMNILKDCPDDFLVVSGDDVLALAQIACGMSGVISVAANAFPGQFSKMVEAALKNDFKSAVKINNNLLPAYKLLFCENNPAGVKAFLFEMGRIENELRLPCVAISEANQKLIREYAQQMELV
ncbi:MAG: 4-hydroxy-tetrahydrodipicolinate synthase [Ferruginibacter sp.]